VGHSWVIALDLELSQRKAWLATTPNPGVFEAWPEILQSYVKRPKRVSAILTLLAKQSLSSVEWTDDRLVASAILANDGSFWCDFFLYLAEGCGAPASTEAKASSRS
jgi:hypothetical protein